MWSEYHILKQKKHKSWNRREYEQLKIKAASSAFCED